MKWLALLVVITAILASSMAYADDQNYEGYFPGGVKFGIENPNQERYSGLVNPGNHETGLYYYDEAGNKIVADTRIVFVIFYEMKVDNPEIARIIEERLSRFYKKIIDAELMQLYAKNI